MYNRISAMKHFACFMLFAIALMGTLPLAAQLQQQETAAPTLRLPKNEAYKEALKKSANTVYFTENKGQWEPSIVMEGETNIGSLVIKRDQLYFLSREVESEEHEEHEEEEEHEEDEEHETFEAHGWGIFFDGMNQNYKVSTNHEIGTKYSYYIGNDPSHWASNVTAYGDVTMHNVYNGIDLRLYSQESHVLEFDWIVNPGANYNDIKMRFRGPEGIRVDENGHLAVKLEFDEVKFDIPEAYQIIDGKKVPVTVKFKVKGEEASFFVEGKVDSRYPLVIDPSLKWGAFFDNNNNAFDEYLYAVDYDNQANVYCGGKINVQLSTSYVPTALYGYDNDYESNVDAILYKIRHDGTAILNVTYLGGTGNDGIFGMSLSPDKSRVFVCGVTSNGTFPTAGTPFDGTFNSGDGFVAALPTSNFGSLTYSSFLGGDGSGDQMVSIRALSNTSYVVGGTVSNSVPGSYIVNAYDNAYSGGNEMWLGKFGTLNTLTFGTYIGGDNIDQLNDIQVFSNGDVAFSGFTASSAPTFPGLVNQGNSTTTPDERDGVIGVIPSAGGTFSMLTRIIGNANDEFYGLTIGPFDTLFVTGYTNSDNFPLGPGASATTRFDVTHNGGQDGFVGKIPKSGGANSWLATYFGGSSNDRGNTLRTYTPYAIMAFGETGSSNFPVQNLDNGTFYDSGFNGGDWDIFWMVLGTDLRTRHFATYVGGNRNDYLGATGDPRGSNHFFVEGDSVITLGTTIHSRSNIQPTVVGPATGPLAVFDADPIATPDETSDDMHFIFKWRLGGNLLNFDYGDAPATYGTPNAVIFNSLKLGTLIDNEDFHPVTPGTRANVDDNTGTDDEDGISGTQVMVEDSAVSFSRSINVTNTTGSTAYLMGWIDFNRNGTFESSEQAKANVANNATTATLTWTVPALWSAGAIDTSYLRVRITADANFNVTNPSPTANSQNGEVEDYLVIRYHCVDLTPALVSTQNPTSCTATNGSITITNANLLPTAQYGIYYTVNGGAPIGPLYLTTANNGSITIPNLGPGTYSAIQVFHPTNPACGDTLANSIVLTNPSTPPPSNLNASATCVGGTLTLTATGTALSWTGPGGFTATGSPVTRTNATTAMNGTYSVTQTVSGCTSAPATISVTINTNPTVTASTSTPAVCVGQTINLTAAPSPSGPTYTYSWSGPASFTSTAQNPSRANAQTTHAGVYTVTVTNASTGCSVTGSTSSITVNGNPTASANTSTPTVCSGGTINLTSSATPSGPTYTYSWSGPASFTSSAQNPSRTSVTTAMSGVYTVTVTNSSTGCSATASTSNITVFQSPTVVASVGSPAYCTGQTISLSASPSGGTSPYTYSWSGPSSFTSTSQNPTRANATTGMAGVYTVTITDANNCSGTANSPSVVVNQAPTVTAAIGSPTYCSGATLTLTSTPSPSGTYTYTWSGPNSFSSTVQNPSIPNVTTAASGAYTVTVIAGTNCSATATTGTTTVNQTPTATATSSSPTYCAGTTIQLNASATPSATYSYSWSGPASFTSIAQNPTRPSSTIAMSGVYTVTITNTATNCSATASTPNITVNPGLSVSAGSNSAVCSGGTLNLTSNATGGTGSLTYNWSGPSFSSNLQNPSRSPATAAFAGVYNVTVSDVNNCSGTATTSVVVNPTATVTVSSNSPVCSGATLNLSASLSGGTSPFTYNWSGPAGFSSTISNPSRTNALTSYSGAYNVTVSDANGCSGTGSTSVVVNQSPIVTAGSSSPTYCSGATINLTSSVAGGATPFTYLWSGPASFTASTANPSRPSALTTHSGVYTVTVTDANTCSGTASTPTITVNPSPTVSVASNSPVCANGTISLTSTPASGTTPYAYLWSGPVSFGSTAQNPTRTNAQLTYSGVYSVTVTDNNLCTATANTTVTVVARPSTPTASSNSPVCTGNTLNLLGSGGTAGATWNWVGPNSFISNVQNPSITNVTTAAAGVYRLYQTLSGCTSDTATTTVVINTTPGAPTINATPATTLCSGDTLTLTATGLPGAIFTWSGPNGYSFVGNPAVRNGVTTAMTGAYTATQTVSGCPSAPSAPLNITINQRPTAPTPTSNSPRCYGDTLKFAAATVAGAIYDWSGPGGYTASVQNPFRANATPAMSGVYSLTITVNGCTSTNLATVTATVTSCPPVAVNDSYNTPEDVNLNVPAPGVLTNDSDPASPQQPLTVTGTPVTNPSNGVIVVLNGNGSFTYDPNPNFTGVDSFRYRVCDNEVPVACDTATVYIAVTPVNDPPQIPDTTVTTCEDCPTTVCLPITDPETSTQTHFISSIYCGPTNGVITGSTVTNTGNPHTACINYTPNSNFNGVDSVCIVVCDNGIPSLCDTSKITIIVTPVNDPPIAVNDIYVSCDDTTIIKNVLVNDSDIDGPNLQLVGTIGGKGPTSGTLNFIQPLGNFSYTPPINFNGIDSFYYIICDNGTPNLCDTAKVTLDFTCTNVPPIANNDFYTTPEDNPLNGNVSTNDSDPDGGTLTYTTTPINNVDSGTLVLTSTGTFTYTPNPNFNGVDSFIYRVCDNGVPSLCDTATAYITVTPVNDPPRVPDTTRTTCEDCPPVTVCLPITDVDVTDLHFASIGCNPLNGTLSGLTVNNLSNPHNVCITYTSNTNFNGTDSFCVIVCDNGTPTKCDTSKITIIVTPVNDPPVAVNDNYTTNEDVPVVTNTVTGVRNNDNDNADGNPVTTLTVTTTPINNVDSGTLSLNPDGSFTYTPNTNFTGVDSFQYRVCDNGTPLPSLCDTATAYINVFPVNDPPQIPDTTVTTCEECPITVCLPITDPETATQIHVASVCGLPLHGTISTLNVTNASNPHTVCVTYTPTVNYNGTDSFCVIVCDNGAPGKCDTSTITIIVTPVNDPPVAVNDNYTTTEDVTINIPTGTGVRANDNDNADGNPVTSLTVTPTPINNVDHGTLTLNPDGSFTYDPDSNFYGIDSFQYRVCDNGTPLPSLCDTATAYITVTPVNDPPFVPDTTITTCEDCPTTTVCLPITDNDTLDLHFATLLCPAQIGNITNVAINQTLNTLCFDYKSFVNLNGRDTVCFIVCDNGIPSKCDTTTITIIVTPVNDPPVAINDNYTTNEDVTLVTSSVTGVRNNDNDNADGNPVTSLTVTPTPLTNTTHGTLTLLPDGSFTYVPDSNFYGIDSFIYRVCDSGTPLPSLCDTATAYITIRPVNDPPEVPDTTITTCEDCDTTYVCVPITDADTVDLHFANLLCPATIGNVTSIVIDQTLNTLCLGYKSHLNLHGVDSLCVVVCDNGTPTLCDTTHITIIVDPVNDPPYADTIYVTTYVNQPIGVNVASATGDVEGDPLTYTYGTPTPASGTYGITGNGAITVTPNTGFTGVFAIPYSVCDLSPYPINSLCDSAAIIVTVLPAGDTLVNHPPVANNDYVTVPYNSTGHVINELANDYDPDGDALAVTVTANPLHGTTTMNGNGTLNYTPVTGYFGWDTIGYTICDPTAAHLPRPLCDQAIVVIYISKDSTSITNDPPVAVDDYEFVCADANAIVNVLRNDYDINGDALTTVTVLRNFSNGTVTNAGLGIYVYDANAGFTGDDTLTYRVCDNGTPSLCDTANAIVRVNANPVITPSVASLTTCSNDSVNITFTSSVPGTTFTWTANNGTSGTGNIHTVLSNTTSNPVTVIYSVTGVSPSGCGSTTITIPVTVRPRPIATALQNGNLFCSGEQLVINLTSSVSGTTYTWGNNLGATGSGNLITQTLTNTGTTNVTVTYAIVPSVNGCTGDTLFASAVVKPRPVVTPAPATQTSCSGQPITINLTANIPGTSVTWTGSNGNSGNTLTINDSPVNNSASPITVTYTINSSFNGCVGNTVTSTVVVRPAIVADAGADQSVSACSASCVTLGGSPAASGAPGPFTYRWRPATGLSDTTVANPTACNLTAPVTYELIVTDTFGCFDNDFVAVTVTPSSLTAEAGVGGALCLGSGDSVQLGGFPTAVGGTPPYTYTWSPLTGLNLTNPANPEAFPTTSTTYYLTVTDALGCQSVDSSRVNVYPTLTAHAGTDTTVCAGSPFRLGADTVARGGSGSGYTYLWSPTVGVSNINTANPTGVAFTTTTYIVTVTDGNGCTATDNILVTINPTPAAHAGPDKVLTRCAGDSVIIGDVPAATGGTPGYTYAWSPATGLSSTTVANPVVRVGSTTTYTLTVTDVNGCSSTDAVTVNVINSTFSVNAGTDKQVCFGNCVQLGGIPTAVGGFPPYTYTWNNGVLLDDSTDANPVACPTITTTFTLRAVDSRGCVSSDAVIVTVNQNPVANAGPDTTVCIGSSIQIGGAPTATGGTPGYTYSWNPTLGLSQPNIANPTAAPAVISTYQLIVTDTKGCIGLDEVTVTPRTTPVVDAGADKTLVSCTADTVIIGGIPAVTGGGTAPFTYLWTPSTGLSDSTIQNPYVTGITATTSYQLIVTDSFGCSGNDFVVVNVVNSTLQVEAGNGGIVCAASGSPVQLGGSPTAVGGTSPYVYAWSNGAFLNDSTAPNPIATVTITTKFFVTVTDAKGCQSIDSVTVQQNPTPTANAGTDTTVCAGFCVTLNASGTGGTGSYQYAWSPTVGLNNNNTRNPLACPQVTTTYVVTVTDSLGCNSTDAVTITIRPQPLADAGQDKTVTGCNRDTIQIGGSPAATGGVAPYTYRWSPTNNLSDSTAANPLVIGLANTTLYSLTVTDASGCSAVDVVQVSKVNSTLAVSVGPDIFTCQDINGTLTISGSPTVSGGTAPYTYLWGSTATNPILPVFPMGPSITLTAIISSGTYFVEVTDAKGCKATDAMVLSVAAPPVLNAGADTAICAGATVQLGGMPTSNPPSGGPFSQPFTYAWSPGTGLSSTTASNPTATPAVTTTYVVTVTHVYGCTASDAVTISVRPNPVASAGPDRTLTACSGDSVQLGGTPAATGGTPPYVYDWSPNAGLTDTAAARPWVKNLGSSTLYTLNVVDTFGCTSSDQVLVNIAGGTLTAEAGNNVSFCFGNATNVTLGGSPTVVGGVAPYTYAWSPAAGLSATNVANPVANTSSSRTYTVVVTDANGCVAQDTVRITVNPRIVVNAGLTDTVCAGSCVTLGGAPTAMGGSGSTYTYSWGPAIYFQGSNTIANPVVCPLNSVTYTVVVTDSLGCTNTGNVTIRVNQNPTADAGGTKTVVSCPNSCVVLGGTPTAGSGTAPYLYAWSPSTSLNNTGLPNPTLCGLDTTGIYTVTVTDANGCTATSQVLVNSTQSTLVADAGLDKTICAGQSSCITIGGTPSVSGGIGPYTITWSPVSDMCTPNTVPNPEVNPTDTTTYVLLVSDANGCVAVDSMTITVNPAVTASVGPDTTICNGATALLGGNPTASGGTAPYTYVWSPSVGISSITSSNPTASPNITTSYCVTVTDAVGCTASTCQRIDISPSVTANAGNDQTMTACPGSFVQIGGSPTGTGGTGNYSYTWAPDSVGGIRVLNGTTIPNPIVTGLTNTTTFTVTVRDNVTGCIGTDQVTITVNPSTLTVDAGFAKVHCANSSSCVQIGGAPTAAGGVAPYIYQWSPGLGLNSTTVANPCANPLITTNYTVTVTDALGCSLVDTVQVFVSPFITANAGNDTIVCYNTSTVLGGPTFGGTGNYTYLWSPSQFLSSTTVANPTAINVTSNISYTLTVRDSLGCSAEDIVTIGTRALPTANAGNDATIFACSADSVVLGGSPTASGTVGPYTYSWAPAIPVPPTAANPVVKNLGFSTNFTVTVTDSFGCRASDDVFITVQPNTVFVDAGTNIGALCSNVGSCVTLGGPILGGTAPYVYVWTGGAVSNDSILNPQACPLVSTTYTLVVTDVNGCQASDTVRVIVNPAPNANVTGLASAYCVSAGNVTMTGIPAGGSFSGPGVTGNIFQPAVVGPGFYCIRYVYTDPSTNCTDDTTICVTVNPDPVVTISGYAANYCRFDAVDTLIGSPAGGTFSGPGITGNVFNPATANIGNNIITYSYSDTLGCSGIAQVTLEVRPVPTISVTANDDSACVGQSVVLTPNYSVDVTNIQWSTVGGGIFASGLNPVTVVPTGVDYCVIATAVNNTNGCSSRDTVCLHVNQPPVANNDTLATCEEVVEVIDVVANDTDPEGDASTVTVLSVNHGTTTVNGPFVVYTPNVNYNGLDTIVYALCNTQCSNACDTGIVAITICPVNDPPVVTDIIDTIYQNQTDTACPVATDVDNTNLTMSVLLCDTLNGTVTPIVNGCFNYTPTFNWIGTQTICVVACDSLGACDTGTVTIVVLPGNRPPRGLDVNVSVCKNTPIGVNVAAAAGDPNGNPLTFSYGTVSGPTGSNGTFTITGNGALVFTGDSAGVYTFPYYVCDQNNIPPYSMCDTALVTVVVYTCDSTNLPPVATDDIAVVLVNDTVNINELANDFDPDGDPLNVTILDGPSLTGATATLNPDGTVTYTSPTTGVDSITYAICDPAGLCDTAYIIIYVDSTFQNHPPVAVDDYASTTYGTPVIVPVLNNDHDPDGNSITITALPCAPADGVATVTGNTVTYVPGPGLNALNPDTFCYVICDNGTPSLCDTATVVITVPNSVQGVNDTVNATPYIPVVIDIMDNDFDPEADSFYVTTVITTNTVGNVTLNPNGTVTYLPKDTCGFTDVFQYVVEDVLGATDTATVFVTVNCCTPPVALNDAATIVPNAPFGINVLANDTINGLNGTGQIVVAPAHGTAVFTNDSVLTYTPAANYCGLDTVVYRLRTSCGIDTALFIVEVYCNTPPVPTTDEVVVCTNTTIQIPVLANDTDAEGDTLTVTAVSSPPFGQGTVALNNNIVTFNAGSAVGIVTLNYTVCDSSFPNLCSTGTIRIDVQSCTPIDIAANLDVTTCMDSAATVCVGQYVSGAASFTITNTGNAANGSVTLVSGDTCFTYTPNAGFVGTDTFMLTVCNNTGSCDSSQVVVSVVDCLIDAIPDACDVNTTIINTSVNVNVLDNDLIPAGSDTTVTIISSVSNGVASVNTDNTVMVTPNTDFVGDITFTYQVCVTTGSSSYCDTASVCVNVVDTNCIIPTGISPNNDGINDQFEITCNDNYPNATLRVYNRWGVEVWASDGHYHNDFKGLNMQNTVLPDGTYFIIYDYKDGVTKPVQRYLVIHR